MNNIDIIVLGLCLVFIFTAFFILYKNRMLKEENHRLEELLRVKNSIIHNYEVSRVVVRKVIDDLSVSDKVIHAIKAGESKDEISKKLTIPLSKIEFIIKVDRLKKHPNS